MSSFKSLYPLSFIFVFISFTLINCIRQCYNCASTIKHQRRMKVFCVYPYFYSFSVSFLPFWCCQFPYFIISFLFKKTSYSLEVGLLVTNSLCFPLFENILNPPLFLMNISTIYSILCWQFFIFSTWKIFPVFLASMFSNEKSALILIVSVL